MWLAAIIGVVVFINYGFVAALLSVIAYFVLCGLLVYAFKDGPLKDVL